MVVVRRTRGERTPTPPDLYRPHADPMPHQLRQPSALDSPWNVPASQVMHVVAPCAEYLPASQSVHVADEEPL